VEPGAACTPAAATSASAGDPAPARVFVKGFVSRWQMDKVDDVTKQSKTRPRAAGSTLL